MYGVDRTEDDGGARRIYVTGVRIVFSTTAFDYITSVLQESL
jgi:hypothetical protein